MSIVTVMSVLVYASVVRIVVWDGCRQSLLVSKLCRTGMATCHCGCHVIAALSRSGFASDVLSCSLLCNGAIISAPCRAPNTLSTTRSEQERTPKAKPERERAAMT